MKFTLNKQQLDKLRKWKSTKNLNLYGGAIAGRFTYCFTPTSMGIVVEVQDSMEKKDKIDLTDYESW